MSTLATTCLMEVRSSQFSATKHNILKWVLQHVWSWWQFQQQRRFIPIDLCLLNFEFVFVSILPYHTLRSLIIAKPLFCCDK
jgi:hypothetical protein